MTFGTPIKRPISNSIPVNSGIWTLSKETLDEIDRLERWQLDAAASHVRNPLLLR